MVDAQNDRNKRQAEANKKYINFDIPGMDKKAKF